MVFEEGYGGGGGGGQSREYCHPRVLEGGGTESDTRELLDGRPVSVS